EWTRDLARELWRGKASSGLRPAYYRYPMLKRLAERSLAVIVHNPAAARIVREHAAHTPVIEIPHLYSDSPLPSSAESLRLRHPPHGPRQTGHRFQRRGDFALSRRRLFAGRRRLRGRRDVDALHVIVETSAWARW